MAKNRNIKKDENILLHEKVVKTLGEELESIYEVGDLKTYTHIFVQFTKATNTVPIKTYVKFMHFTRPRSFKVLKRRLEKLHEGWHIQFILLKAI